MLHIWHSIEKVKAKCLQVINRCSQAPLIHLRSSMGLENCFHSSRGCSIRWRSTLVGFFRWHIPVWRKRLTSKRVQRKLQQRSWISSLTVDFTGVFLVDWNDNWLWWKSEENSVNLYDFQKWNRYWKKGGGPVTFYFVFITNICLEKVDATDSRRDQQILKLFSKYSMFTTNLK